MSDEKILTGEQALAEGRGKIELPEVIEIAKSYGEIEPDVDKSVTPLNITLTPEQSDFLVQGLRQHAESLAPTAETEIDSKAFAEALVNFEPSSTFENEGFVHTDANGVETFVEEYGFEDSAIVDRAPVEPTVLIAQALPGIGPLNPNLKANALGTQDFCPDKHNCNHKGADYCKQARLEADHKAGCPGCTCFHPARGIPSPFRRSNDGRI